MPLSFNTTHDFPSSSSSGSTSSSSHHRSPFLFNFPYQHHHVNKVVTPKSLSAKEVEEFHRQVDETKCHRYEKEQDFLHDHNIQYEIPATYDFTKSTESNYSVECLKQSCSNIVDTASESDEETKEALLDETIRPKQDNDDTIEEIKGVDINGKPMIFVGKYRTLREKLDYDFHCHYCPTRQLLHDKIIDHFLNNVKVYDSEKQIYCESPLENWIVFTAGTMGAGKGHTMKWLDKEGLFPMEAFVKVDPDEIRRFLPETPEYNRLDDNKTGYLTQKEVGYISEVRAVFLFCQLHVQVFHIHSNYRY